MIFVSRRYDRPTSLFARRFPFRLLSVLLLVLLGSASAQQSAENKVDTYFRSLLNKRFDLALRAFGIEKDFSASRLALLKEFRVIDPTPVGKCEDNLDTIGKALNSYNELYGGYPKSLNALVPYSMPSLPHCPSAPKKPYIYNQRDEYFCTVSCPTGHGRTPGFPMYSPIDGVIPNPNLRLLNYYNILSTRVENGLTKVKVAGATPQGSFERDFVFTPSGGFVSGDFTQEAGRLIKAMTQSSVPRTTNLDSPSLLLGVALFSDEDLVQAAHCRLLIEKLYFQVLGIQTRMGEKGYDQVAKHIKNVPKCPTSGELIQVKKLESGKILIYCPGAAHSAAGLPADHPQREF